MSDLHIYSKPEAGLVYLGATEALSSPRITHLDGSPSPTALLHEELLEDGRHRYLFEAGKLHEGKRCRELLWGDVVANNVETLLPQKFWILFCFYHKISKGNSFSVCKGRTFF